MKSQLIKLKSGEEIICDIVTISKTKYQLTNPYIFKSTTMINPFLGLPYDLTTLKDWLMLSDIKKITIPANHIVSTIQPSPSTIKMYKMELKRVKQLSKPTNPNIAPNKISNDEFKNFIENVFNNLIENKLEADPEMDPELLLNSENDTYDQQNAYNEAFPPRKRKSSKNRPMIEMSMIFPPEVIIELMEAGIINVNDVNILAKDVKRKLRYTGDERHRKDFGNKMTDWNSDLNSDDYK